MKTIDHYAIQAGQSLREHPPQFREHSGIHIPSRDSGDVYLTKTTQSKHILALGSIGSGKTNCLCFIAKDMIRQLRDIDRCIFFDAKGDFEQEFAESSDVVIGKANSGGQAWNLFAELMNDPNDEPDQELLCQVATTLFDKAIKSSQNPAFPSGARDIFMGLTQIFIRRHQSAGDASWNTLNNAALKAFFLEEVREPDRIAELVRSYPDLQWLQMYVLARGSATTQSFLTPLLSVVNEMFVGCFARAGSFSIRKYITSGGRRRKVFISYDAERGCILDSMYTVILDLAMRQSLGRSARNGGDIFFMFDELPIIPALTYLDQALNFGRSLGIKIFAGIQNTSQMAEKYGENRAISILSGFSTCLCFHLFDEPSRAYIKARHGRNIRRVSAPSSDGKDQLNILQEMDVIADWDITGLSDGRCIISLPAGEPFFFHPDMYTPRSAQIGHAALSAPRRRITLLNS